MTAVLFVTYLFKRKNNYTLLFSTAIAEGIKDMFSEMGYGRKEISKKENDRIVTRTQIDQDESIHVFAR